MTLDVRKHLILQVLAVLSIVHALAGLYLSLVFSDLLTSRAMRRTLRLGSVHVSDLDCVEVMIPDKDLACFLCSKT